MLAYVSGISYHLGHFLPEFGVPYLVPGIWCFLAGTRYLVRVRTCSLMDGYLAFLTLNQVPGTSTYVLVFLTDGWID